LHLLFVPQFVANSSLPLVTLRRGEGVVAASPCLSDSMHL
jgi:hypothetical protein